MPSTRKIEIHDDESHMWSSRFVSSSCFVVVHLFFHSVFVFVEPMNVFFSSSLNLRAHTSGGTFVINCIYGICFCLIADDDEVRKNDETSELYYKHFVVLLYWCYPNKLQQVTRKMFIIFHLQHSGLTSSISLFLFSLVFSLLVLVFYFQFHIVSVIYLFIYLLYFLDFCGCRWKKIKTCCSLAISLESAVWMIYISSWPCCK